MDTLTLKWTAWTEDFSAVMEEISYCLDLHVNMLEGDITPEEKELHEDRIRVLSFLHDNMKKTYEKNNNTNPNLV